MAGPGSRWTTRCGHRGARRHRNIPRDVTKPDPAGTTHFPNNPLELPRYEPLGPGSRHAKAYGRGARGAGSGSRRRRSRSTARSATRRSPRSSSRHTGSVSSRCTIAEQQLIAAAGRSATREAGGMRSGRRSPRSSRARTTSLRMAAISRVNLRLAGSHAGVSIGGGRPVADGSRGHRLTSCNSFERRAPSCDANQTRSSSPRCADTEGIVFPAHAAPEHAGHLWADEEFEGRRQQCDQVVRRRQRHDRRHRSHGARGTRSRCDARRGGNHSARVIDAY